MKLHLPTRLRAAVLACFAVVTSFTTTLATGAIAGGAFAVSLAALAAPQASAASFDSIEYGGDFFASSYQFSFILDDSAAGGNVVAAYWGNAATGSYGANGFTLVDNGDGTYGLKLDDGALNNTNIDASTRLTSNRGTTFEGLVLQKGIVYTVTADGIVGGDNGAKATVTGVASGVSGESGTYNSNMNGNQNPPYNKVNDSFAVSGATALVWGGTGTAADMTAFKTTSGAAATGYDANSILYFDASAGVAKTANVSGDITVGAIRLYDNYTISAAAAANITAAGGITVVGDKTMTLSAAESNTSANTISADFSGKLAVAGGNWNLSGAVDLSAMSFAAADGDTIGIAADSALTFADTASINLGNLLAGTTYKIFDLASGAALNGWDTLTAEQFIVNGAALSSSLYEVLLQDGTFTYNQLIFSLTWDGGESGVWNLSNVCWDANGTDSVFGKDIDVVFNNSASVEVQEVIIAGKLTVASGNSLSLSAAESASLALESVDIQGNLESAMGISVSGEVTMADASHWNLLSGAAQSLTQAQFIGVKAMEIATGASLTLDGITTGENGSISATQLTGGGELVLKLSVNNGVNFDLSNFAGNIRVEKKTGEGSARLQMNGSTLNPNATITLATNGDLVFNGAGTVVSNDIAAEGVSKLFVNNGKSVTISSDLSGAGTITKTAAGTLTFTGNSTVSNFISEAGTTNVNAGTVTRLEVTNGTVNVQGGTFGNIKTRGGTTNVQGGTVQEWLDVRGGTANLSGGTSAHIGVGQNGTLNVTGAHTTGQLRMSEQGVGNVNIRDGANLVITGSENGVNTSRSILISHWGHASTLLQEGGSMTATDAVVFTSWTGTGVYKVTGGTASVKGISFLAQSNAIRGSFLLGTADAGTGRVDIGSEGINKVSGSGVTVQLGNGTLGATADWTMGFDSGATSAGVQLIGTVGGTVFDTMGHTITVNTTLGGGGKLVKDGDGALDLVGAITNTGSFIVKGGQLNIKGSGPHSLAALEVKKSGALTVDTDAAVTVTDTTLAAPITNKGTLTLAGTLAVSDLSGFTPVAVGGGAPSYVDADGNAAENGYLSGQRQFTLIENTGTLNDDAITSVSGVEGTYADGVLTVTGADMSMFYVNTTVDATALGEGKKYKINGGTLNVGTDTNNILRTAVGSTGKMVLNSETTLKDGAATVFAGDLEIASGSRLCLGYNVLTGQTDAQSASISSLNSVVLDGGTLFIRGVQGNIGTVVSKADSTGSVLQIHDMTGANKIASGTISLDALQLNASLSLKCNWKSNIEIALLTGAGNVEMEREHDDIVNLNIASLTGYSGTMTLGASNKRTNVSISTGATAVSMGGIVMNSSALNLNVQANTTMSNGLSLSGTSATVAISSGAAFSGAVNVSGAGNSLTSSAGGMNLSQLNVAEGAALDLNGSVSALLMNQSGTVDTAGLSLTDGAVLTYGNAANLLNVTDSMLAGNVVIGNGLTLTDAGVNLGLSSAIAQEKIGISNYADAELAVVGDTWYLKAVPVSPSGSVRYYWENGSNSSNDYFAYGKWSLTDDDSTNTVSLPSEKSNVVLVYSNDGTAESPIRMRLNTVQSVNGVEVVNGYYRFWTDENTGSLSCSSDLSLSSNGHLILDLPMSAANLNMAGNSELTINKTFTLADGGDVTVTGSGASLKLGNGQNLTADALNISAAGASLSLSGSGDTNSSNTVTLNSISMGEGSNLSLNAGTSNVTVAASALSLGTDSTISIGAGQVLDLSSIDNMDDEDTGRFSKLLNATSGAGTLKVSMPGEFRMKTDTNLNTHLETAQLKINSYGTGGKTLTIGESGDLDLTGKLILQSTAKVVVAGGAVSADKIELGHSTSGNPGHFALNSGTVTIGGFVHYNSGNTFTMSGGTLEITTGTGISNGIATTITGGTLVANTADWGVSGATVGGAMVQGSNTITLTNATLTGVITNSAGKLALAGTVNVLSSGYTAGTVDGWSASGNGYQSQYAQYTLTSTAENLTASGVTAWQVDGSSDGVSYADGVVKVTGSQDTTTYWVNTGTVQYSDTDSAFDAATTTLKLNGNAADGVDTLQLNTALKDGVSIVAASGSSTALNLNGADVVLDASQLGEGVSASTVTLTGNGKYTQTASGNALNLKVGGVTDAANWTGTVSISGNINNINLNSYGNANSSVELSGVSGYWQGSPVFNTNVILTNPSNGTPAVKVTNANSGAEITFAGSVSGTGDIYRNTGAGGTQTYIFAGDVSDWFGTIKNNWTTSATIVKFTGSSEVNANFDRGIGNGNKLYNLQLIVDDSNMDTPTTVVMNGSITATSLTVTEGTTAKINGALALDGALTTNGVTQLAGDAAAGTVLGQIAGTGALEILQGDVTVNKKTDFSSGTLKLAAGSTLNLDLTSLGVTDLKNWSDAPLLTLGTLDTLTTGGKLNLDAQVGSSALLTLGNGDTKVLASITNCTAELESLLINGGASVNLPGVDGMEYKYELVQNPGDGVVNVLIRAVNVQEGWVAQDTDPDSLADTTWTNSDVSGDGKWSGVVGEFYGHGSAEVNVDEAGVEAEKVIVSVATGVTEYTFKGGELNTGMLAVNKGGLVLDNAGTEVAQVVILSNMGTLTVEEGKTLTVGEEPSPDDSLDPGMSMGAGMAVSGEATLVNKGTTMVNGTLSVGDAATVNNSGMLDVDTLDASGATIANTGTLISGGGIIGTLSGEGSLQNSGVLTIESDTTLSTLTNSGSLTVDGQLKVLSDVSAGGTVTVASAELGNANFASLTVTDTVSAGELSVGTLEVGEMAVDSLIITDGAALVKSDTTLEAYANTGSGTAEFRGNLTVNSDVVRGGALKAAAVTVNGNAAFTAVTADSLTANAATLKDASLTKLNTSDLAVEDGGTVTVKDSVVLKALAGTGTLQSAVGVSLTEAVNSGVSVETPELVLQTAGNVLGSVTTDAVTVAEGATLSTTDALLTVDGISSLRGDTIGIAVSDSAFDALNRKSDGTYIASDYLLISGADSADLFSYVNTEQLSLIQRTGMIAGLTVTDGVLSLSISAITNEAGEEVGMIWDASGGNMVTNNGCVITTGEGFYRTLDYVQQVIVTDDVVFDLSADSVGDSVAGNAAEPLSGLLVRNLSGGGELTIKGNSAAQDIATLISSPDKTVSAEETVGVTADAVTVNIGLSRGAAGYLESDMGSVSPALSALRLRNRAVAQVNSNADVSGDTDLADFTRLRVTEGNMLTTGMLSGTDEAEISGVIRVNKGGVYTGSYDEASIIATSGSKLRLRTGGRRSLSLSAEAGADVTLDAAGQDSSMDSLRVGEAPMARLIDRGTASLNLLNTAVTEDGVQHSTITVNADEGNYINKVAVTLSLGAAETARSLSTPGSPVVLDGVVDVTNSSIVVNMLGNSVQNGVLEVNTAADKDLTLARFVTAGAVSGNTVTLTGTPEMMALINKYYTNVRLDKKGAIKVDRVMDYYASRLDVRDNAQVGISMADAALVKLNPQANRTAYRDLAGVLDSLDAAVTSGNHASANELGAAVSGASVAALGAAVAGDVERQLVGIRNRTTSMGVDQTQVNEQMPYFNAWINAEGDFRRMDADGTAAGYELSSWGGTVGFDVDLTPRLTMGLAATAMYGNFTAKSADRAEGDLDTYYVTGFARYAANRWSHTFVATAGMADTSLSRTVSHASGSYGTEGDAEAVSFGFLYELGYVMAMNESATACLQPVFNVMLSHSSMDGYAEDGGDAALKTGGVDMTTVTFGLGARAQAIMGTNLYNRSSMVEARALLKVRAGDREAESENELALVPGAGGSVTAAEMGIIGAEVGVGLTVPLGSDGGSVFADASVELGSGYTNINGTVGYRINF